MFGTENIESADATVMFVFGDSYADTGNHNKSMASWLPPYGITYPGKPSGRYSNGRVLTDFVASYFNVNSPVPYEHRNDSDRNITADGINFAYGGTGVFNTSNGLPNLTAQINLLKQLVVGVYSVQDLESSLVLVSVAGNDYSFYLQNHGYEGVDSFVPKLIKQLSADLELLYKMGIRKVAVTALEPLGCLPYITIEYSYNYCNETANGVALLHNGLLQEVVDGINKNLAGVKMVVLDQYGTFMPIFSDPQQHGCFTEPILKPCCTGDLSSDHCGSVDNEGNALYDLCTDPTTAFFWDIVHPTQETWHTLMTSYASSLKPLLSFVQNRSSI